MVHLEVYRRFQGDFLVEEGGRLKRGGYVRGTFLGNFSWGKKISMKGAQDFLALFKKKLKNKYESFFN